MIFPAKLYKNKEVQDYTSGQCEQYWMDCSFCFYLTLWNFKGWAPSQGHTVVCRLPLESRWLSMRKKTETEHPLLQESESPYHHQSIKLDICRWSSCNACMLYFENCSPEMAEKGLVNNAARKPVHADAPPYTERRIATFDV